MQLFEYTTASDQYFNYCWWPYKPVAPTKDKLRPVSLLFHSFATSEINERAYQLVHRLRDEIGMFRTVWGAKQIEGTPAWEFYFYDYERQNRSVSISQVLEAVRPLVSCDLQPNESLPYFMFSLDVSDELITSEGPWESAQVYIGNPGSTVSSGLAYELTASGMELQNLYFFFDAKRQFRQAAEKVLCSANIANSKFDINRILWPEFRDCHTICVANKRYSDTVYFSGVKVEQLLFFLERMNYPEETVTWVRTHSTQLDHLLFDVGYDFQAGDKHIDIVKSGYYGVF